MSKARIVLLLLLTGILAPVGWVQTHQRVGAQIGDKSTTGPVMADEVALGAQLFEDTRLSRDSSLSCATCHSPYRAFSEPRPVSHGVGVRARKRNSPSLINVAIANPRFDWDGRAATPEGQLRGVFSVDGDMGLGMGDAVTRIRSDACYDEWFQHAYGKPADVASLISALVAFERSLVVAQSRFDRFFFSDDTTALTESERRGWTLFRTTKAGCAGCHIPVPEPVSGIVLFRDLGFHNLGVGYSDGYMADVGRYGVTRDTLHWGTFRTPSLRNVALTAPYMHDGSLPSLRAVVDFYARGGNANPGSDVVMGRRALSPRDRADLVAFMRALTTEWLADTAAVNERLLRFSYTQVRGRRCGSSPG